jgi:hypothetical protein
LHLVSALVILDIPIYHISKHSYHEQMDKHLKALPFLVQILLSNTHHHMLGLVDIVSYIFVKNTALSLTIKKHCPTKRHWGLEFSLENKSIIFCYLCLYKIPLHMLL